MEFLFAIIRGCRVLLWLSVAGCGATADDGVFESTDTGNAFNVELVIEGALSASEDDAAGDAAATVEEASLGLHSVTLKSCDDDTTLVLAGPFAVDLSLDTTLGSQSTAMARVCSVELTLQTATSTPASSETGLSLFALGTTASEVAFELRSARVGVATSVIETIDLEPGDNTLTIRIDPRRWFDGVEFGGASVTEGVVLIDEEHNPEQLDQVHDRVSGSMHARHRQGMGMGGGAAHGDGMGGGPGNGHGPMGQ